MTREEKNQMIDDIAGTLSEGDIIYLADISDLDAENTSKLRRLCFSKNISIRVVKNTLLKKAMEKVESKDFTEMYDVLKGNTAILLSDVGNAPAKLIKEFRKKQEKPLLKAAYVEEAIYVGDDKVDVLSNLKSKNELIADVILLLQSPAKNVISGLGSGGQKLAGIIKTLQERSE